MSNEISSFSNSDVKIKDPFEDPRPRSVKELRVLVLDDPMLKKFRTDEEYLLRFLHCTDFDAEDAFKRMQNFCSLLHKHPQWFGHKAPLEMKEAIDKNVKVMIKERDKSGRRIYIVRLGKIDAANSSPQLEATLDEMWIESVLEDPKTKECGVSVIMDMSNYSWRLFRWLTPSNLRVISAKADLYPCKEILYHIVNTSALVNASIKLAWPFLTAKIKNTVKFHFENWPSLHEYIDADILPPEYGGTGPEINFEQLNQILYDQSEEIGKRLSFHKIA